MGYFWPWVFGIRHAISGAIIQVRGIIKITFWVMFIVFSLRFARYQCCPEITWNGVAAGPTAASSGPAVAPCCTLPGYCDDHMTHTMVALLCTSSIACCLWRWIDFVFFLHLTCSMYTGYEVGHDGIQYPPLTLVAKWCFQSKNVASNTNWSFSSCVWALMGLLVSLRRIWYFNGDCLYSLDAWVTADHHVEYHTLPTDWTPCWCKLNFPQSMW